MAEGTFDKRAEKGFCSELDQLADTLNQTAEELEKTENYRKELLANVSHDLRTPLTLIKGYAEMVRDISWEEPKQREEDLAVIIRESDRLTGLVNEILEYTALQSEEQPAKPEPVDLSSLTDRVISQFEPLCTQNGCRIDSQIEPGLTVYGNQDQLARVLYNLIDNAIAHSGEKREIQVVLKPIGTLVRAEIRDYGNGIPKENLPHVWDRYFTSRQRKSNGQVSGLGLAIAKEILLAHKAEFGVESQLGFGSVFWFQMKS